MERIYVVCHIKSGNYGTSGKHTIFWYRPCLFLYDG